MSHQFFKSFFVMALILMFSDAYSAQWEVVYDANGFRQEIDRESMMATDRGVEAWDKLSPPGGLGRDPDGFDYRYVLTWSDYDCAARRMIIRRRIYVGDDIRQVKEQMPISQPIVMVNPGTPREKLWHAACGITPKALVVETIEASTVSSGTLPVDVTTTTTIVTDQPILLPNRQEIEISAATTVLPPVTMTSPSISTNESIKINSYVTSQGLTRGEIVAQNAGSAQETITTTIVTQSSRQQRGFIGAKKMTLIERQPTLNPVSTVVVQPTQVQPPRYLENEFYQPSSGEIIYSTTTRQ